MLTGGLRNFIARFTQSMDASAAAAGGDRPGASDEAAAGEFITAYIIPQDRAREPRGMRIAPEAQKTRA